MPESLERPALDSANAALSKEWYDCHRARLQRDSAYRNAQQSRYAARAELGPDLLEIRDDLAATGDVQSFSNQIRAWSVQEFTSFNGPTGQMVINQFVKHSTDDQALVRVLSDALRAPGEDQQASAKITAVLGFISSSTGNARFPLNNIPFVLSYFWAFEGSHYPTIWPSGARFVEYCTGVALPKDDPAGRYQQFLDLARLLDEDTERFLEVANWWWDAKPAFLDSVLVDRSEFGGRWPENGDAALINAKAMVRVADYLAKLLAEHVSHAAGRSLTTQRLPEYWVKSEGQPRGDLWVDWRDQGHGGMGVRIWINQEGVSIGLRPGRVREGWIHEVAAVLQNARLTDFRLIGARQSQYGEPVGHRGGDSGELTYAKWYEPQQLADIDLPAELDSIVRELRPLLDELSNLADGTSSTDRSGASEADDLAPLVREFRDHGYPTPADGEDRADRARFELLLAQDAISLADPVTLRAIWNTGRYGGTGPMSVLNVSFRDADPDELDRILETLRFVCWGGEDDGPDDAARINEVLNTESERYVRGLGESVTMKLLAICHPDRYLLVYPFAGPKGKKAMLTVLGLPTPASESRGEQQVEANDALRRRLDHYFPGDLLGMSRFLYWLLERGSVKPRPPHPPHNGVDDSDPIADLAEELLLDESFLSDLISLLEEKGQIILYGPPGTGKTYVARKLAEVLVEDSTRRSLVQFHPSTSYEDFFEGYRPETSMGGSMAYRLTPGPLALLASRSAESPGKRHVMIIDEINRANLPKVLGELLFLLEYRNERVRTLYRPEDAFELPKDLWFIGTMNTADRSIALIDAALRRRFYFVPFFPNEGPMEGLLDRWLAKEKEPAWVGALVTMVNDDLTKALGGPHLQLGPSYFMKKGLNEQRLRRIWRYAIEPFIEDQFFGDAEQIARFRFDAVLARFQVELGPVSSIVAPE